MVAQSINYDLERCPIDREEDLVCGDAAKPRVHRPCALVEAGNVDAVGRRHRIAKCALASRRMSSPVTIEIAVGRGTYRAFVVNDFVVNDFEIRVAL